MTGKHRDLSFKLVPAYAVGTKLKLGRIVKEKNDTRNHVVRVSAKRGSANDVYILYASEPKNYLGQLVEVGRVDKEFMRNTYYLRPVGEAGKVKRASL